MIILPAFTDNNAFVIKWKTKMFGNKFSLSLWRAFCGFSSQEWSPTGSKEVGVCVCKLQFSAFIDLLNVS